MQKRLWSFVLGPRSRWEYGRPHHACNLSVDRYGPASQAPSWKMECKSLTFFLFYTINPWHDELRRLGALASQTYVVKDGGSKQLQEMTVITHPWFIARRGKFGVTKNIFNSFHLAPPPPSDPLALPSTWEPRFTQASLFLFCANVSLSIQRTTHVFTGDSVCPNFELFFQGGWAGLAMCVCVCVCFYLSLSFIIFPCHFIYSHSLFPHASCPVLHCQKVG